MRPAIVLAALSAALLALPVHAAQSARVDEVNAVTAQVSGPRTLTVCARATVMTGGYTAPTLKPAKSSKAGIYHLDFTATPPTGLATQMVSQISTTFVWRNYPAGLKGVRVRGEHGSVTALVGAGGDCGRG